MLLDALACLCQFKLEFIYLAKLDASFNAIRLGCFQPKLKVMASLFVLLADRDRSGAQVLSERADP